jgi:hypothetical protein
MYAYVRRRKRIDRRVHAHDFKLKKIVVSKSSVQIKIR